MPVDSRPKTRRLDSPQSALRLLALRLLALRLLALRLLALRLLALRLLALRLLALRAELRLAQQTTGLQSTAHAIFECVVMYRESADNEPAVAVRRPRFLTTLLAMTVS